MRTSSIFTKANVKKSVSLLLLLLGVYVTGLGTWIKIQTTLALRESPQPEAILMLGGNHEREPFTAQFAAQQEYPLEIWVSSGVGRKQASQTFQDAGIPEERVHLDYQAVDTVTNFSTLVDDLKAKNIHHVYLITSDFHMPRSKAIATIILGSQGIAFTPIEVPSSDEGESLMSIARDVSRSILWTLTGRTAATLNPQFHKLRAQNLKEVEAL
ncbi:YdcF family protein [Roseofilum sp. BLCC_M154]|uniref:YdcF family protein n=1 Tax=Roseofilum acuticapitatum BLCC-M154 TaxID=3022444 RepID=A0ABT7ANW7_9CYAN|nr:YdcF family protein [Roseofilum acuticapitatum]MDJ1168597.1 YdcF family protein [Roseofilum acuticapitatum BLCC-M154]